MDEPFAIEVYRQFAAGRSAAELAAEYGISRERIEIRLRAAAQYLTRKDDRAAGAQPPVPPAAERR